MRSIIREEMQAYFLEAAGEGAEEEKEYADLLSFAVADLEDEIKSNKPALSPEHATVDEAVLPLIAGVAISFPALLKVVGKVALKLQRKIKGKEIETNVLIKVADKAHNAMIGGLQTVLKHVFRIKDPKTSRRLAVILFHVVVAVLLISSGGATIASLKKSNWLASFGEGFLTAIKSGEIGAFLTAELGEIATLIGSMSELADAADLADAIELTGEDMMETSTMSAGDVEGSSGGLGKEADIYDVWKQKRLEENNMNKFKITKGRLRQIIFEEVQRAKRLDEAMPKGAERDEAAQTASETDAAQYMTQAEGVVDEAEEGGEGVYDIFNLPEDEPAAESSGNPKEDALRDIVRTKTASKVEGADVDLYSASAVVKVLDSLSDDAKNRFLKLDVSQMAEMAMRLMKEDVAGEDRPESEEHYRGAAEDDWSQIRKLEKDAEYDRRRREKLREDEKADKDYDGDGEVESSEEEWKGSRDKAIKKAVTETLEGILSEDPVDEGLEDRLEKFNKGPSTEERREKLKKIAAANKAKKEKDKK